MKPSLSSARTHSRTVIATAAAILSMLAAWAPRKAHADSADPDPSQAGSVLDRAVVDYETGPVFVVKNDHRYGADGTDFGVDDTLQQENLVIGKRISVEVGVGRHTAILLYAPLDVTTRATLTRDIQFRDTLFAEGTAVDHRYLFDGYRASYLYRLFDTALTVEAGGSLQIRNAKVAFTAVDGSAYSEQSDIGLVPVLKLRVRYQRCVGERSAYALLDADALSTFGLVGDTEGGIYDVALALGMPVTDRLDLVLRARGLGGGATVPAKEIENWAHFLSFTVGVRFAFGDPHKMRASGG